MLQSDTRLDTAVPASTDKAKPRRKKKRASSAVRNFAAPACGSGVRKYSDGGRQPGQEPPEHFHVNLAEIPFVTGKVAMSHSLG